MSCKVERKEGEICQKEKDGYLCCREKGHKGKHHAHAGEECFLKW